MNEQLILQGIPKIKEWIQSTLNFHNAKAERVTSLGFPRLASYFPWEFLTDVKVINQTPVPLPPLSKMGLTEFADFEGGRYTGITYGNTYFVTSNSWKDESLHFHELIHVVQWQHFGWDQFLKAYATGLLQFGYLSSPLEVMARFHQRRFDTNTPPYDVRRDVIRELSRT